MSTEWNPDWVVAPGEFIQEEMAERGVGAAEVAAALGLHERHFVDLLEGRAKVTPHIANVLAEWSGASAELWTNLERIYRDGLAEGKTVI